MTISSKFRVAFLAALLPVLAMACDPGEEEFDDVPAVACDDVASEMSEAHAELRSSRDTPGEALAQARVDSLTARQAECRREVAQARQASNANDEPTPEPTEELSEEPSEEPCPTWEQDDSDTTGNRWFANGIPSIAEASDNEEARDAAAEWLESVKADPVLLRGAGVYLLDKDVDSDALFDEEDCATETAQDLVGQLEVALSLSQIAPSEAPESGYNSGVSGGEVVTASNSGISGDRRAVQISLPAGKKVWIMARCGNPVVVEKLPVPEGPTDEPERQPPPKVQPPKKEQPPPKRCPDGKPVPANGLCPKKPEQSVNNNPAVPEQVRKDEPSDDNQDRIDKGPRQPVDDSTGGQPKQSDPAPTGPVPGPSDPPRPDSGAGAPGNPAPAPTPEEPPPAPPQTESPDNNDFEEP